MYYSDLSNLFIYVRGDTMKLTKQTISFVLIFSILTTAFSTLLSFHAEELKIVEMETIDNTYDLTDVQYAPNRVLVMLANTPDTEQLNLYSCYSDNYEMLNNVYEVASYDSASIINSETVDKPIVDYATSIDTISSALDLGVAFTEMRLLNPSADTNEYGLYSVEENQNNIYVLELDSSVTVEDALEVLNNNPNVEIAEPDIIYAPDDLPVVEPNDEFFDQQYGLINTFVSDIWCVETGDESVVVGIIDTGIDGTHPDLVDNLWENPNPNQNGYTNDIHGYDFCNRVGGIPTDDGGHGTHVAGIVGAKGNNEIGVSGVCWDVSLAWLGVSDMATSSFVEALNYCNLNNIQITCNSYGGGGRSEIFEHTIDNYDGLFIASAGNEGVEGCYYPAKYDCPNIISVAAVDCNNELAGFSNRSIFDVDVAAPGVDILSTYNSYNETYEGKYKVLDGTSMAAPFVAGIAALIKSYAPYLSPIEIKARICGNVHELDSLTDYVLYGGIVDAYSAIADYASTISRVNFFDIDILYASEYVITGERVEEPEYPIKNGYFFAGWYEGGSNTPFNFNSEITEDVILFAKWVEMEDGMFGEVFPDYHFCNYVLNMTNYFNNASNTYDSYIDQDAYDWMEDWSTLSINNRKIRNLTGIEHFANITKLDCKNNRLTSLSLSVSNHPYLIDVDCSFNLITDLNIDGLSQQLTHFNCYGNKLTELDTSQYPNLRLLSCGYNELTTLSLNNLQYLTDLNCEGNKLTYLDVYNRQYLTQLDCSDNLLSNWHIALLPSLQVLDCSNNYLTSLHVLNYLPELTRLDCYNNDFNGLHLYGCTKLNYLDCRSSNLSLINITSLQNLTTLYCGDNNISSLDISNLENLRTLNCDKNNISSLDISNLENLRTLSCDNNNISTLDISNQENLTTLSCNSNNLKVLDPSNSPKLVNIECSGNNIVKLSLYNSNKLTSLNCSYNELIELDVSNTVLNTLNCTHNNMKSISNVIGYENIPLDGIKEYTANTWNDPFTDVSSINSYFYDIEYVYVNGIMNGTGSSQFSPNREATRQEIFIILYRVAGSPDVTGLTHPFNDVANNSSELSKAVKWAYNSGITNGTSATTFEPNSLMRRQDLAVTIARYLNSTSSYLPRIRDFNGASTYSDYVSIDSYARDSVEMLYEIGILSCTDNSFGPKTNVTRHQLATIFSRLSIALL